MAALTFSDALLPLAGTDTTQAAAPRKAGIAARFMAAVMESRRRNAEREIARIEAAYGIQIRERVAQSLARDLPF
ncbi:MAG: hypothetical protein LCH38_01795 [Proteobacteria bacterium]|nr:hypothetical protein [Pseudomonadota bacterium]